MKTLKILGLILVGVISTLSVVGIVHADIASRFDDVDEGAFYFEAVETFAYRGVINGYNLTTFKPDNCVTRGELAAILKRYDDQLLNTYREGGVGDLLDVICGGFKESDLTSTAKTNFVNICTQP